MSLQQSTVALSGAEQTLVETLGQRIALFAIHLAFCIILLNFHSEFTAHIYTALTEVLVVRSFEEVALGIAFCLVPLFWIPVRLRLPSQVFGYILYLGAYVPFNTVGLQSVAINISSLLPYMLLCCFSIIGMFMLASVPPPPIRREGMPFERVSFLLSVGTIVAVICFAVTLGFSLKPINLDAVYDFRADRRLQFSEGGVVLTILKYFIDPTALVASPFLVLAGLLRRNVALLIIGAFATYAGYQTSGQKDALGGCFIALTAVFVWGVGNDRHFGLSTMRITAMFIFLMFFASLYDNWIDDPSRFLSQLTVGRLFIATGMISSYWVEFFSDHPLGFFTGSGLLGLLTGQESEYGIPVTRVIGLIYAGSEEHNANTNMWADGYGNLGYAGVLISAIVAMVIFRVFDRLSVDRDRRYLLSLSVGLAFVLTNGPITGLVSTNGFWLLLLIAYFLPRTSSGQSSSPASPSLGKRSLRGTV